MPELILTKRALLNLDHVAVVRWTDDARLIVHLAAGGKVVFTGPDATQIWEAYVAHAQREPWQS
jgi:hypothetical protein